jgi:hypothetical protein
MKLDKCCICGSYTSNGREMAIHIEEYNFVYDYYCFECLEYSPSISDEQDDAVEVGTPSKSDESGTSKSPFILISEFSLES